MTVAVFFGLLDQMRALSLSQNVIDRVCDSALGVRQIYLSDGHVLRLVLIPVNLPVFDKFGVRKLKFERL